MRQSKSPTNATERVLASIREAIIELELLPGTMIDKNELCAQFGVSRFPVSDALNRLQAEGLVEILPQRGSRVARISTADLTEAMFIRRPLEAEMIRTLAPKATDEWLFELDGNLAYQALAVERGDRREFHRLDLAFHEMMLARLGFPRVTAAVDAARNTLSRARKLLATPRRLADTLHEHLAILAALKSRDGEAGAAAMNEHLNTVLSELSVLVAAHPGVFVADKK